VGSVGFKIVELLRAQGTPVRAMVRRIDQRSEALAQLGADAVAGDLTDLADVHRAIEGCQRVYYGMAVSAAYLEATLNTAAVARYHGVEVFVNISQMTVSQMNIHATTTSLQQKYHWLAEQTLNWSGPPVVHLRSTVFLEHPCFRQGAAESIAKSGEIRLPFGTGRTSPIATLDVARVATEILLHPQGHIGKVYDLTGPRSQDMEAIAAEYSAALGRHVKYVDVDPDEWEQKDLQQWNLPEHLIKHFTTMAWLHRQNRYDRFTDDVERITGVKPMTVEAWVRDNKRMFQGTGDDKEQKAARTESAGAIRKE
jgi:uncharacterized protein YbjT (DUF2867 family)